MLYNRLNYLTLNVGGGYSNYEQKRKIRFSNFDKTAKADYNGYSYHAGIEYGINFMLYNPLPENNDEPVNLRIINEVTGRTDRTRTINKQYNGRQIGRIRNFVMLTPKVSLTYGNIVVDDYKGGTYETVISGLHPGREYNIYVSANYRNKYDNSNFSSQRDVACSTLDLLPDDLVMELHPTSVKITGTYAEGDATVLTTGFSHFYDNATLYRNEQSVNGLDVRQEGKNTILEATGLHPEKKYCLWYFVETQEGGRDSVVCEFTTPELEFSTFPAKATSNTVALICAETNLSDRETGAGFEWRRYDAPDLVPSDQSPCPVVDGVLTGALRNLSASTYYKFRPYYTSASGETYYGEWLAFSTADAYVYFDPTVRTYEATGVTATEARVRGYAIAGSDDITEQGFEYWPMEAASKRAAADVQRVQATGQLMTATLEDLQPGTVYTFRVYVETVKGTTYGEEQVFTTESGGTAISDIESDVEAEDLQMTVRKVGNKIFVRVTGYDAGMAVWTLTALNGAVLSQGTVTADGSWQPLNVSGLSRGVYLLTARSLQSASTVKFSLF